GPSWRILDPIAAVIVSLFIARVAFKLFVPSIQELLEKSLPEDEEQFIINVINETEGASLPHSLRTRRIGNNRAIDVHFCMDGNTTLHKANEASRAVERKLRQKFGKQTFITTHVEPLEIPYVPPTDR
ncbi:MAG: cation-efflux pump, partial [Prevotella sp.]|nr:cation-efflux pump [Prevotella sp.]